MKQNFNPKRLLLIVVLLLTAVVVVACSKKEMVPYGDLNLDETYVEVDGYKVTVKELYDQLRMQGAQTLSGLIDRVLFESELAVVRAALQNNDEDVAKQLDEMVNSAIFGTSDQESLKDLTPTNIEMKIAAYVDSLYLLDNGLDRQSVADALTDIATDIDNPFSNYKNVPVLVKQYELRLAQRHHASEQLKLDVNDEDSSQYITDTKLVNYYKNNYQNRHDLDVFFVRFLNANEANAALRVFSVKANSAGNYYKIPDLRATSTDGGIDRWKDVSEVTTVLDNLNIAYDAPLSEENYARFYSSYTVRTNTSSGSHSDTQLTDEEVFALFVDMANLVNPLSKQLKLEDGVVSYADGSEYKTTYTYEELGKVNSSVRNYFYNTLVGLNDEKDENETKKAFARQTISSNVYFLFKLESNYSEKYPVSTDVLNEKGDEFLSTVPETFKTELRNEFQKTLLTSSYITSVVDKVYEEATIEIYDPIIRSFYESSYTYNGPAKNQSGVNVAKVNDQFITVESLYTDLEKSYGVNLALDILVQEVLKGLYSVTDAEMKDYDKQLKTIITNFSQDAYASSGFPASMGRAKFLLLAFGAKDMDEAVEQGFVLPRLRELYLNDIESHYDDIYTKLETLTHLQYDNFKSITVNHLLVYLDANGDGTPDNPKDYFGDDVELQEETEAKLVELIDKIYAMEPTSATKINDIVNKFNASGRIPFHTEGSDDTWIELRKAGFTLKYESLSSSPLTNTSNFLTNTSGRMDEVFYERAMDIYDILVQANEPKDRGDFYLDFYLDNPFRPDNDPVYPFSENDIEKVKSSFGYHFIFVTNPGSSVPAKASALYKESSDTTSKYTVIYNDKRLTAYNDSEKITASQIEYYMSAQDSLKGSGAELPSDITSAFTTFFTPVLNKYKDSFMQRELFFKLVAGENMNLHGKEARFDAIRDINKNQFTGHYLGHDANFDALYATWFDVLEA